MGCCGSADVVPDAPAVIISDPGESEQCQFTIKEAPSTLGSRDFIAYKGVSTEKEARWLFLNKVGSQWGGHVRIELENFVRTNPEDKDRGQILWSADFVDDPAFRQALRVTGMNMIDMFRGFIQDAHGHRGNDHYYLGRRHGGWNRDYFTTLFIDWNMSTYATLTTQMRQGWGFPIKVAVFASGTALARYYEVEEPIFETRQVGEAEDGQPIMETVQVGMSKRWEKDVDEFVDTVQFQIQDARTGAPLMLANGMPLQWLMMGDSTDFLANYSTPFFTIQQQGGWISAQPPLVQTALGIDPALSLLMAHLATSEFSSRAIKNAYHPNFPQNPVNGIVYGMF